MNLTDRSRFYVGYDEFTADRPANRLIHLALRRLSTVARRPAKWKRIDPGERNHGVSQSDVHQLFAYGKRYGCRQVALLYPKTAAFRAPVRRRFVDDDPADALTLSCFPFDVDDPKGGAGALINALMTADGPAQLLTAPRTLYTAS